jgi:CubicO group peptidase (beta-lactamase class C family)
LDEQRSIGQDGKLPAFVAGATTADGEIYFNANGNKIVNDATSGDVDPDSVFWICSMTKMLTHITALQLIDAGKLDPETPVADIFPQLNDPVVVRDDITDPPEVLGPAKNILRVKHLLNFTSGTYSVVRANGGTALSEAHCREYGMEDYHSEFFRAVKGSLPVVPLKHEPGTDWNYGFSADILGFVVEKVTGQTLDAVMQENIFSPLGVKGSFYLQGELKEKLLPIAYRRSADGKLEPFASQPDTRIIAQDPAKVACMGGGGLYMSLRSYLTILRHLLQIIEGKAANPILKLETVKQLFEPAVPEKALESINVIMAESGAPPGMSWSKGAMTVTTQDWKGRKKAGSAQWGGWLGMTFWIDPTTGVAGVSGVQLLAVTGGFRDPDFMKAAGTFEEKVYAALQ